MAFRVEAVERTLQLAVQAASGPAAAAKLAAFAREQLQDAIASQQASPTYLRYVNGREGASEDSVRLPGPIVYRFSWLDEVAEYALEFLRARSPYDPARRADKPPLHYRDSHMAMVEGRVVATSADPAAIREAEIPPGAEIVIASDAPYSRKIEVGIMTMRVPPGVYEAARQSVLRQYRQVARADLRFVQLGGGYTLRQGSRRNRRKDRQAGSALTYPALVLNLRD